MCWALAEVLGFGGDHGIGLDSVSPLLLRMEWSAVLLAAALKTSMAWDHDLFSSSWGDFSLRLLPSMWFDYNNLPGVVAQFCNTST